VKRLRSLIGSRGQSVFLFLTILTLILVTCLWVVGDVQFRTKVILTLLYLASFALLFAKGQTYFFFVGQCVLAAVIGVASFGIDFLMRRH
jgi:hypothetical protein